MIRKRKEGWGMLQYDGTGHRFSCVKSNASDAVPYSANPVVLNIDLTMKCNMRCRHCVTKDFEQPQDLTVSKKIISWINRSPFMVVVITGGEPFLPEYEDNLITLLRSIGDKGLIIDTNGTMTPSDTLLQWIRRRKVLVRVSWDSVRPQEEILLRKGKKSKKHDLELYYDKIERITEFSSRGVEVAAQSVVHGKNIGSLNAMASTLRRRSIKQWYLQRLIPSHKIASNRKYKITDARYGEVIRELTAESRKAGVECISKKDRRHNSVFLLVGDGLLYTQGEKPRQKILLGKVDDDMRYFDYVSSSDHCERYYG